MRSLQESESHRSSSQLEARRDGKTKALIAHPFCMLKLNCCVHLSVSVRHLFSPRYRIQVPVERTPVSRVFLVPDEFHLLQHRATITAVRRRIEMKGLLVRDAFIAFNSSRTGALSCSEMNGALEWLGIRVTPSQVFRFLFLWHACEKEGNAVVLCSPW